MNPSVSSASSVRTQSTPNTTLPTHSKGAASSGTTQSRPTPARPVKAMVSGRPRTPDPSAPSNPSNP